MTNGYKTGDSYEKYLEYEEEQQSFLTKLLIYEILKEEKYLDLQQRKWFLECWRVARIRFELLERTKLNLWENFTGFYVNYIWQLRNRRLFMVIIIVNLFLFVNIAVL